MHRDCGCLERMLAEDRGIPVGVWLWVGAASIVPGICVIVGVVLGVASLVNHM